MYGYIYKTTDTSNDKIYIGQHKSVVFDPSYNGSGKIIKRIKRKRPQDLTTEVIEWCETKTLTNEREKYWIATFDSQNPKIGYNITNGGEGGNTFGGKHHTEEARKKIGENSKKCLIGRHLSQSHKQHISEGSKGKINSLESRIKLSEARKGIVFTEEHKHKLSKAKKGRKLTDEHKKNIGTSLLGHKHTELSKQKISEATSGKPKTKHIWMDSYYNLYIMSSARAMQNHPDWVLVE